MKATARNWENNRRMISPLSDPLPHHPQTFLRKERARRRIAARSRPLKRSSRTTGRATKRATKRAVARLKQARRKDDDVARPLAQTLTSSLLLFCRFVLLVSSL